MNNQEKILLAIIEVIKQHRVDVGAKGSRKILFETQRNKLIGLKPVVLLEIEKVGGVRLKNWAIKNFEKLFPN